MMAARRKRKTGGSPEKTTTDKMKEKVIESKEDSRPEVENENVVEVGAPIIEEREGVDKVENEVDSLYVTLKNQYKTNTYFPSSLQVRASLKV
jgi:hypothetical protein